MSRSFSEFFQNVCNKLTNQGLVQKISTDFSKLSTDCDRYEYILNLGRKHELRPPCCSLEVPYKDSAQSIRLRNEGNDSFIKGKGTKALKLYTRSVLYAPTCAELSLAYGNRSAVLFSLGYFEECEADINRAIQSNYPDDLMFKLMKRKGECLCKLKRHCEARKSYEDSLVYLKAAPSLMDKKRNDIESNISQLLSDCRRLHEIVESSEVSFRKCLPILSGEKNEEVFCASNAVTIHFSEEFGRHVVANKNIIPGDVLAVEDPFASVLLPEFYTSHCYHCLRRSMSLIPCDNCCNVMYCSVECRKISWLRYHEKECSILYYILQLDMGKMAHLSLRIILTLELSSLHKTIMEIEKNPYSSLSREKGFSENGIYDSLSYATIYQLEGHSGKRCVSDLFKRAFMSFCIVSCLKHNSAIFNSDLLNDSKNLEILAGGLILRHLQNMPCNAHEVSELFVEKIKANSTVTLRENSKLSSSLVEVGAAAYAFLSLINHSCDPNVVRHSCGNKAVLRAIRPINRGEQILDNYGYHYAVHSLDIRQSNLKAQYFFDCNCFACLQKWPCYQDLNETNFERNLNCPDCKIGCMKILNEMQDSVTEIRKLYCCNKCGKSTNMTYFVEEIIKSSNDFRSILTKVLNGERVEKEKLVDHLLLLDRILVRPWKEYNDCQEALKHCYALEGNCFYV